jgi:hypothetical protein
MRKPTTDPSRSLSPIPDGALVRIELRVVGSFLAAPFGPLTLPDPQLTVTTSIPGQFPDESHWKRTGSAEAWSTLAGLQPTGEHFARHSRESLHRMATFVCCSSPIAMRMFEL